MCQLSLFTFNEDFDLDSPEMQEEINKLLYVTSVVNSQEHPDGHGISFFDAENGENYVRKYAQSGLIATAVNDIKKDKVKTTSPILYHVRKTSTKYNKKGSSEFNSHPFEGDNFILAHNGTFSGTLVTGEKNDELIDSQIFHRELEKLWKEKKDKDTLIDVLQQVLDKVSGKYALIFKNKTTKEWFVVRGYLADLHKVDIKYKGKVVGYFINTESSPIYAINNLAFRFTNFTFDLKESPEELDRYHVYKVGDKELEEIGKVKYTSNTVVYNNNYNANQRGRGRTARTSSRKTSTRNDLEDTNDIDYGWIIDNFIGSTKLSIPEVNLVCTILGHPIPYIKTKKEYLKLEGKLKEIFSKYYRKEKREIMGDIVCSGVTLQEFHQTFAFPYFVLSTEELKSIRKEIVNE